MEVFSAGTTIVSGPGALSYLKELKPRRLFLVTDPYFEKNGTAERIGKLSGAGEVRVFSHVTPDPSVELAAEGTAEFQAFGPDLLAALGGGSAIDLGKAIYYFSKAETGFAAIPTTSGSGSEVTDFAILTHAQVKHPLVDRKLRPTWAILDPELLQDLPGPLIADAGFDVIAHAAEAAAAVHAGVLSDLYAREAFRRALACLPGSYQGRKEMRLPMHLAATMAGIAFNQAGLGLCHGISHSLGGLFHVPHGRLNAILLPAVIEANRPGAEHAYGELARAGGLSGASDAVAVRNLLQTLVRLRRELGLPATLAEAGVELPKLHSAMQGLVETTLQDPCCKTNPVPVTGDLVLKVLRQVEGHG